MSNIVPDPLTKIIAQIFTPLGLNLMTDPVMYKEHKLQEYGATHFILNNSKVEFRIGKKTNDRPGHFLTSWYRRVSDNKICPFHVNDIDCLIIYVHEQVNTENYQGLYFFGKNILLQYKILSTDDIEGKLSFRVFPPWSEYSANESIKHSNTNIKPMQSFTNSARKTQLWQNKYFIEISSDYKLNDSNILFDL
jgi:hypothetical protein